MKPLCCDDGRHNAGEGVSGCGMVITRVHLSVGKGAEGLMGASQPAWGWATGCRGRPANEQGRGGVGVLMGCARGREAAEWSSHESI